MKRVVKLRNQYRAAYRYYKVMKILVREGEEALRRELASVEESLEKTELFDKEYKKLVAMENVIRQFEAISFNHTVIELTPYNFDYVVNSERDVLITFYVDGCGPCESFAPVFVWPETGAEA